MLARSGIAPFRGFWLRRWEQCQQGDTVGTTLLYFGCRKKTMNLLKHETDMASKSNQGYHFYSSHPHTLYHVPQFPEENGLHE